MKLKSRKKYYFKHISLLVRNGISKIEVNHLGTDMTNFVTFIT